MFMWKTHQVQPRGDSARELLQGRKTEPLRICGIDVENDLEY